MLRDWLQGIRKYCVGACAALAFTAGTVHAADNDAADLRQMLEQQRQTIDEQNRKLKELEERIDGGETATPLADKKADAAPKTDSKAVQKIVADYLKDHPGAGMPSGVQTGWAANKGFYVDSAPGPKYSNWEDESKIPFELRIRGRIQADYYFYKVTDNQDHLRQRNTYPNATTNSAGSGATNPTGLPRANSAPDFSQLEVKRLRLIFEGTVFDPNLRYHVQLDGSTRGIDALSGGSPFQGLATGGVSSPGTTGVTVGSGIGTADHALRLFSAYVAYDWHPCCSEKGCGPECGEGSYKYSPTISFIVGKIKPYFSFEEVLGSANQQFVEYAMTEWFFDADDDNLQTMAAIQGKFLEDRLFTHISINNSNESQVANRQNQRMPAFNVGFWYDFGGSWNEDRKKWDLYGDSASDIDYSCKPVARVGAMAYIAPLDRRSQYSNGDIGRIRAASAAPGGTGFTGLFSTPANVSGGAAPNGVTIDKFDDYVFEAFWAAKWRGFSILNDWFIRDLNNFKGTKLASGVSSPLFYTSNLTNTVSANSNAAGTTGTTFANTLFPRNKGIVDYGCVLQGGYFIVPKKWEVAARWSWIHGQSGNINGNGTASTVVVGPAGNAALGIPAGFFGANTGVRVVNGAFSSHNDVNEYAIGLNYYWKRQLLKWQTDVSVYQGGNPAAGGASATGFIPGVDGWLLRTQVQLAF